MYYLKTQSSFDAAPFLADYDGQCKNIHGHRWKVIAEIRGRELNTDRQTRGMLMDFGDIRGILKGFCNEMDHSLIYETGSLKPATIQAFREEEFRLFEVPFRPTAENFACYYYKKLADVGLDVHRVEVYETPTNCAAYEED